MELLTEEETKSFPSRGDYFCDCFPSMIAMKYFDESFNLFPLKNDIFNMSTLCLPEKIVRCAYHTSYDVVPSPVQNLDPTPKGLIGASMGTVDLLYQCDNTSFPVVFDSGDSLAITMYKSDFVGPIRPLTNYWL